MLRADWFLIPAPAGSVTIWSMKRLHHRGAASWQGFSPLLPTAAVFHDDLSSNRGTARESKLTSPGCGRYAQRVRPFRGHACSARAAAAISRSHSDRRYSASVSKLR
jgi:hypothetical protein